MAQSDVTTEYVTYVVPVITEAETRLASAKGALSDPSTERSRILSILEKAIAALKAGRP